MEFEHELGGTVTIGVSGEMGTVVGRAEFSHRENEYLVRYSSGAGTTAQERWWGESALS